ncbi:MAG: DUF2505 domain-containing protein [Leptospirales bacterium]|jgi:hypothetical protein
MKKITVRQEFEYPLGTLLLAREERYKHLDKFPELKNVHIIEEIRENGILKQVRHIDIGESLPMAISALMPGDATVLVESSEFNEATHEHSFHVIPGGGLDNIFTVTGVSRYHALDDARSARDYDIEIRSRAFLVGPVVEGAIAEVYSNNLNKDRQSILNFIKQLGLDQAND